MHYVLPVIKNIEFVIDDDYGQKTVSVLLDGQETDLEIVDHPACEMSVSNKKWVDTDFKL